MTGLLIKALHIAFGGYSILGCTLQKLTADTNNPKREILSKTTLSGLSSWFSSLEVRKNKLLLLKQLSHGGLLPEPLQIHAQVQPRLKAEGCTTFEAQPKNHGCVMLGLRSEQTVLVFKFILLFCFIEDYTSSSLKQWDVSKGAEQLFWEEHLN